MISKIDLDQKLFVDVAIVTTNSYINEVLNDASPIMGDITTHLTKSLGKGIRTQVLLYSSMDENGYVSGDAVKAAAVVELLHMATLVHDDVIDDAPLRRGIETVQKKFGKKQAVLCGDYLLCLGMSILSTFYKPYVKEENENLVTVFTKALSNICLGEYNQYKNNGNLDLSIYKYIKIISGKTAALFHISAYAGAIIGNCNEKQSKAISRFGLYLGIIFQIIDDCKDYEFSESQAQKTVGNDIISGVVTLPLILAMSKDHNLRKLTREVIDSGLNLPLLLNEVCRLGGTDDSRSLAQKYERKAESALSQIDNTIKKDKLLSILHKAMGASTSF